MSLRQMTVADFRQSLRDSSHLLPSMRNYESPGITLKKCLVLEIRAAKEGIPELLQGKIQKYDNFDAL